MVLLNISQIARPVVPRSTHNKNHGQVENVDISNFFYNFYKSPEVKYKNMDFKNLEISKCPIFAYGRLTGIHGIWNPRKNRIPRKIWNPRKNDCKTQVSFHKISSLETKFLTVIDLL